MERWLLRRLLTPPTRLNRWIGVLNAPIFRKVTRWLAEILVRHCPTSLARRIESTALGLLATPPASCPIDSVDGRFHERYLNLGTSPWAVEKIRNRIVEAGPRLAAIRIEALARIGILTFIRHALLQRCREVLGSPTTLLTEAQLAFSPACSLDCVGCYTREERLGHAPEPALPIEDGLSGTGTGTKAGRDTGGGIREGLDGSRRSSPVGAAPDRRALEFYIDQAASCGAVVIHVVGKGEPFQSEQQSWDLLDAIESHPHLLFTVFTNGTAISPALARRIARLGNLLCLVSVDGPREIHDARRGEGNHARVLAALELLHREGALHGYSIPPDDPVGFVRETRTMPSRSGHSRNFIAACGLRTGFRLCSSSWRR